jgi:hypothetical protein
MSVHAEAEDLGPVNSWVQFKSFTYCGADPASESLKNPAKQYLNPILAGFYPANQWRRIQTISG